MSEFSALVFVASGGALILAAFISAYNTAGSGSSSPGLGIVAAAFGLSGALCYWAAAWLLARLHTSEPDTRSSRFAGPGVAPDRSVTR